MPLTPIKLPNVELLIKQLHELKHDTNATRAFEMMSGGFIWSDEMPEAYDDFKNDYAFRFLLGYRASLTIGKPRQSLQPIWDAVRTGCPDWPGFRPERFAEKLKRELDSASRDAMQRLGAMDARCRANGKNPARPSQ